MSSLPPAVHSCKNKNVSVPKNHGFSFDIHLKNVSITINLKITYSNYPIYAFTQLTCLFWQLSSLYMAAVPCLNVFMFEHYYFTISAMFCLCYNESVAHTLMKLDLVWWVKCAA